MSIRLAACEPCRKAKLACGHERPTCARCQDRDQIRLCVYRARPFRRKNSHARAHERQESLQNDHLASALESPQLIEALGSSPAQSRRYPNPGFLGVPSHSTIFDEVSSYDTSGAVVSMHDESTLSPASPSTADTVFDQTTFDRANHVLNLLDRLNTSLVGSLIQFWLKKGVNLPLAEPLVAPCVDTVMNWKTLPILPSACPLDPSVGLSQRSRVLLENTCRPLVLSAKTTVNEYFSQILDKNLRWETLGIFFTAATRAALDITSFAPLYHSDEQRRALIKALTYIGDCCLETCLALDCLNDLQLVLQYENLIAHSQVDGDQSYHSWRRMGDVASSLFALGYHEKIDEVSSNIPRFVAELRRTCFARIYAADKNQAIFLGRPPRIMKEFCYFQLPNQSSKTWDNCGASDSTILSPTADEEKDGEGPKHLELINYTADTRYAALFAVLKEEILRMFRKRHDFHGISRLTELRTKACQQWNDLPSSYHLSTSLKNCSGGPFKRDFLAGARLDYLHVHFLLGLLSQRKMSEPDETLLTVASEMLSIAVEMIILRDRVVNSGTSLIWKVAQYGLPAAGIISLALLNSTVTDSGNFSRSKMVQDLSVLVAEITIGAWIQPGEPNFELFSQATRTIQSLLKSLISPKPPSRPYSSQPVLSSDVIEVWDPYFNSQSWELEMDFWTSLAEHPTLMN